MFESRFSKVIMGENRQSYVLIALQICLFFLFIPTYISLTKIRTFCMYFKISMFLALVTFNNLAFSSLSALNRVNPLYRTLIRSFVPGSHGLMYPGQINICPSQLVSKLTYRDLAIEPVKPIQCNLFSFFHPLGIHHFPPAEILNEDTAQEKKDVVYEWVNKGSCRKLVCHDAAEKLFLEFTNQEYVTGDHNLVEDFEADVSEKILNLEGHHLIAFDICSDHYRLHSAVIEINDNKFRVWSQFVLRYSFEESVAGEVTGQMTDHLCFRPYSSDDFELSKLEMESFFKKYCSEFHDKDKLKKYLHNLALLINEISKNKDIGTLNILSADLFGVSMWTHSQDNSDYPKIPFNRNNYVKGSLYISFGEVQK